MNNSKEIKTVGILGMGALGLLYGNCILSNNRDVKVFYIVDEDRKARYSKTDFTINGSPYKSEYKTSKEAEPLDLMIVSVKGPSLMDALETAEPFVGEDTTIISVMNGIVSEEIIGEKFGSERVVYCVAQGMDAMKFGSSLNYTQFGTIFTGKTKACDEAHFNRLVEFLEKSGVPFQIEDDIIARLWFKFMLNVGINQTCMAYGVPYGVATKPGEELDMMISAMREVISIAEKEGITLTEEQLFQCIEIEKTLDPNATPSMGQDRINKKKSEVELFAGTVIAYAEKHNIPCPANRFYYDKIKEIESAY